MPFLRSRFDSHIITFIRGNAALSVAAKFGDEVGEDLAFFLGRDVAAVFKDDKAGI